MYVQVKHNMKTRRVFSLMLLVVAMLLSCSERVETEIQEPVVVSDDGPIELAFACAPSSHAGTRLDDMIIQQNDYASAANYRMIDDFHFVSFRKEGDIIQSVFIADYGKGQVPENKTSSRYYHFGYCNMPQGANGFLLYAKAVDATKTGVSTSVYNGNLHVVVPDYVTSTSDIYAEPVSIMSDATVGEDGIPADAWTLANTLTAVVNDSHNEGNTLVWKTSTNNILRNLFQRFTNNGADLPGSAASVKQWMLDLARSANEYIESDLSAIGVDEKTLLAIIKEKAETKAGEITVTPTSYPRDINLPDGAAALRWVEVEENSMKVNKFVPQMQTTTLDDINSVSRFVYPPALYYFVNSGIWTSNSAVTFDQYRGKDHWKATSENDANAVQTLFTDGEWITSSTKTVAIADPLQYAVAHLTMEVKAGAEALEYGAGNENTIDISKLTLKGVIIGGQRPVDYQFKPIDNSEFNVNFVYDSQVSSSTPLTTTGDTYHTLALQSYDGENINVILEFEYSGDTGFKCLNGYVYPGTRFYLVGEVKLDANALNETDDYKKRVFTQDYTTTIEMTVQSLEKAYNVLPSLLSNSLEIGVMITPQWFSAKPSEPVVME